VAINNPFVPSEQYKQPEKKYSKGLERVRSVLQGMTLGTADEIGSGIAAAGVVATTDKGLGDLPAVYREMMGDLSADRSAYREDSPIESTALEIAGGVGTGIASGAKIAGTRAGKWAATNLPRWANASILGGAEAGIYGAASADPGERLERGATSAAIGAAAAPVAGLVLDKGAATIGAIGRWAKNKLGSTPKKEAISAIRAALAAEGLDPDEAVAIYQRIGPDAMLADVGENFRALSRAAVDNPGPAKAVARKTLDARQMGQQGRLLSAAESAVGQKADDLAGTVAAIAKRRADVAGPLYKQAFDSTPAISDPELAKVLSRPTMKSALRKAATVAGDMGDEFSEGSLKHLHYAKMALDKTIKDQKFPPHLMQLKRDLLNAMDAASPDYKAARAAFAGESELLDAATAGRAFLKTAPDKLDEVVTGMTQSELDLFKMGAMAGIQDLFDDTRLTHDAAAKLIAKPGTLKRLARVFGDEESATKFLEAAWREAEMGRTRAVLTGGSPTAERLAGQKWLEDAIQPESLSAFTGDPMSMVMAAAREVFSKKPLSQGALDELSQMLLTKGMPEAEVRRLLQSPRTVQVLQNLNREMISRSAAAGGVGPAFAGGEQ